MSVKWLKLEGANGGKHGVDWRVLCETKLQVDKHNKTVLFTTQISYLPQYQQHLHLHQPHPSSSSSFSSCAPCASSSWPQSYVRLPAGSGWPHTRQSVTEGKPDACLSSDQSAYGNLLHPLPTNIISIITTESFHNTTLLQFNSLKNISSPILVTKRWARI